MHVCLHLLQALYTIFASNLFIAKIDIIFFILEFVAY